MNVRIEKERLAGRIVRTAHMQAMEDLADSDGNTERAGTEDSLCTIVPVKNRKGARESSLLEELFDTVETAIEDLRKSEADIRAVDHIS
jgi:hypothetical protein